MRRRLPGFSLLELLIVIAIIGILISMLIPVTLYFKKKARVAETYALLDRVAMALQQYRLAWGAYPIKPGGSGVFIDHGSGTFDPGYYQVPCVPAGTKTSGVEDNAALIKALCDSGQLVVKPSEIVGGKLVDSFGTPVIVRFLLVPPSSANQGTLTEQVAVWSYGPDCINHVNASPTFSNAGLPSYDQAEIQAIQSFSEKNNDDIIRR